MPASRLSPSPSTRDQQGSIAMIVAAVLAILGALLLSIQAGYDALEKQHLRQAADLTALSAVQALGTEYCDHGVLQDIARRIGLANGVDVQTIQSLNLECGRWSKSGFMSSDTGTPERPLNAVRATLSKQTLSLLPPLFGASRPTPDETVGGEHIQARATAVVGPPIATFSVGSRLLSLDENGLLGSILKTVGLNTADLRVLDSDGLASASITPAGLLEALGLPATVLAGVGTPAELAKVQNLQLGELLQAYAELVSRKQPAGVDLAALRAVFAKIGLTSLNIPVRLLGEHGILAQVAATDLSSALGARIQLTDLIGASLILANGKNLAILNVGVPGLAQVKASVIEPPTLKTASMRASEAERTAHNAQIQLELKVGVDLDIGLLRAKLELPVHINLANSAGRLTGIDVIGRNADFQAKPATAYLCIGKLTGPDPACADGQAIDYAEVGGISLIAGLIPVAEIKARTIVPLLAQQAWIGPQTIPAGETRLFKTASTGSLAVEPSRIDLKISALGVIPLPGNILGTLLSGVVNALNALLTPLLQTALGPLLGLSVNETDIHLYSVTRGAPYLVQ